MKIKQKQLIATTLIILFLFASFFWGLTIISKAKYISELSNLVVNDNGTICANDKYNQKIYFSVLDKTPEAATFMASTLCENLDYRYSTASLFDRISEKAIIWKLWIFY